MRVQINRTILQLVQGDITREEVDAIVNAANSTLLGGGGVDGAIHRAAGPQLLAETRTLGGCATGDAKISRGYRLKARHVIHAVGPVYNPRDPDVPVLLVSAYRRSLEVALANSVTSIAFPAISTGVYGYPVREAAPLALGAILDFCAQHEPITLVRYVLFDAPALAQHEKALRAVAAERRLIIVEG
ncbi:MAG: O-acetyl-ADP-ribose deacetylase [Anaerolineae bacterium]|nr:O-acetyl-ADP-ribose deacetylase [Anaerolineae bacterium]NUQ03474.1 O-acetyl-ADP-ribose deacetylase [Anaerolineae bacterium]